MKKNELLKKGDMNNILNDYLVFSKVINKYLDSSKLFEFNNTFEVSLQAANKSVNNLSLFSNELSSIIKMNETLNNYNYIKSAIEKNIYISSSLIPELSRMLNSTLIDKNGFFKIYSRINAIKDSIDSYNSSYKFYKYKELLDTTLDFYSNFIKVSQKYTNENVIKLPEKTDIEYINKEVLYAFKDNELNVQTEFDSSELGELSNKKIELISLLCEVNNNYRTYIGMEVPLIVDSIDICKIILMSIVNEEDFKNFISGLYIKMYELSCETVEVINKEGKKESKSESRIFRIAEQFGIDASILTLVKNIRQSYQHEDSKGKYRNTKKRHDFFKRITDKKVDLKRKDWIKINSSIINELTIMFSSINKVLIGEINKKD